MMPSLCKNVHSARYIQKNSFKTKEAPSFSNLDGRGSGTGYRSPLDVLAGLLTNAVDS